MSELIQSSEDKKTVYFLGAGASHGSDFNLPMMVGFFERETLTDKDYPALYRFVNETFPGTEISSLNLEEAITHLELSLDEFGSIEAYDKPNLLKVKEEFDTYVRKRLSYPPINDRYWCENHKFIFERLGEKDTIISLNYDLIAEYTLFEVSPKDDRGYLKHECLLSRSEDLLGRLLLIHGERPSFYPRYGELGYYLKLHGSINWLYCPNNMCGNHQLFFPHWMGTGVPLEEPGDPCSLCGSGLASVIIPPTMKKTFEKYPKLGLLWSHAYRELKSANGVMMIGMSLPDSDYYLKWLIRSAIIYRDNKPKIGVVNKHDEVCSKVKQLTGVKPIFLGNLDSYVERLKQSKVS